MNGARPKSKIPTEGKVDLRREKMGLKSGMKRCNGGRSTESERKRIPDTGSSIRKRSTTESSLNSRFRKKEIF